MRAGEDRLQGPIRGSGLIRSISLRHEITGGAQGTDGPGLQPAPHSTPLPQVPSRHCPEGGRCSGLPPRLWSQMAWGPMSNFLAALWSGLVPRYASLRHPKTAAVNHLPHPPAPPPCHTVVTRIQRSKPKEKARPSEHAVFCSRPGIKKS